MTKRIVSILLVIGMLLSLLMLTSCGGEEDTDPEHGITAAASSSAVTLVMWLVTNDTTTPEAIQSVQKAFSAITEEKFKARVFLKCYTEDEYYQKLEEAIAYREGQNEGADVPQEEETFKNEFGFNQVKYPDPKPFQVDIIYFSGDEIMENSGLNRYYTYVENGWLLGLDAMLDDQGKKWSKYISRDILEGVQYSGSTYAVPNYNVVGEYEYMFIDRELFDKYYQNAGIGDVKTVFDLESFVDYVAAYEDGVLPIAASFDHLLGQLAHFWSVDPSTLSLADRFSVVGYTYTDYSILSRGRVEVSFQNLFNNTIFKNRFHTLMKYKIEGMLGDVAEGQRAAVQFVNGNGSTLSSKGAVLVDSNTDVNELYGEIRDDESVKYYAIKVGYPTAVEKDLFDNMFGIYARCGSANATKSMMVLNELNTNPTLRNILQYGIQDVNYVLNANGQVHMLNDTYSMNIEKTGNVMIAAQPEGTDPNWQAEAFLQNRDTLVDPLFQFKLVAEEMEEADSFSQFFMTKAEITESVSTRWDRYHKDYLVYDPDTHEFLTAPAEYDDETDYYSWAQTRPRYVIAVEFDDYGYPVFFEECPEVFDPEMTYYVAPFDVALAKYLYEYSDKVWEKFMGFETMEEVDSYISSLSNDLNKARNEYMKKATDWGYESSDPADPNLASPYSVYYNWLRDNRFLP